MQQVHNQLIEKICEGLIHFDKTKWFVVGIDGNCGSGKTSLANTLGEKLDCDIIHMDDFFPPANLRTAQRLSEPAGNLHYERFQSEVIEGIISGNLEYRVFDCKRMDFTKKNIVKPNRVLIIEGSYSFSHDFHQYYNLKIFTKCDRKAQLKRLEQRVGKDRLQQFIDKWIPLEEKYFNSVNPHDIADIVIDTGKYF